jgi:hypothetical protein
MPHATRINIQVSAARTTGTSGTSPDIEQNIINANAVTATPTKLFQSSTSSREVCAARRSAGTKTGPLELATWGKGKKGNGP